MSGCLGSGRGGPPLASTRKPLSNPASLKGHQKSISLSSFRIKELEEAGTGTGSYLGRSLAKNLGLSLKTANTDILRRKRQCAGGGANRMTNRVESSYWGDHSGVQFKSSRRWTCNRAKCFRERFARPSEGGIGDKYPKGRSIWMRMCIRRSRN